MPAPLVAVTVASTYRVGDRPVALPARLARATPDTAAAIAGLATDLLAAGGALRLSDLYRSRAAQEAAWRDWRTGVKQAYSPPPGGSMHEAGRALDLDLAAARLPLDRLWPLAAARGLVPIIDKPDSRLPEAWHFECRGSHALVHDHYARGRARNMAPAAAMAASAILTTGVAVDRFGDRQATAQVQAALIRLGHDIGALDGRLGPRTLAALATEGLARLSPADQLARLEASLARRFPAEWTAAMPAPAAAASAKG